MGVGVTVVCPRQILRVGRPSSIPFHKNGDDGHYYWEGIEVFRPWYLVLGRRHLGFNARSFFLSVETLCESLHARRNYGVIVGYNLAAAAHVSQCLAKRFRRPSVSWAIGSDVNTYGGFSAENMRLLRHNIRHTDLILTESNALRSEVFRVLAGPGRVCTYYKGIDLGELQDVADRKLLRRELGLAPDGLYAVSAGRVCKGKGSQEFYQVLSRLAKSCPKLNMIWVGDGPDANSLRKIAAEAGLDNRFKITGFVSRGEVLRYMAACDMLVFPSYAEGVPNAVMEAMATGIPVIASDVGGIGEIIADGFTGRIVPPRNINRLVEVVEEVLGDPQSAKEMAERGRGFIRKYFDVDRNATVAADLLNKIAIDGPGNVKISPCVGIEQGMLPLQIAVADEDSC